MQAPFQSPPVYSDWFNAAGILAGQSIGNNAQLQLMFDAVEPGRTFVVEGGPAVPAAAYHIGADFVMVALGPTTNFFQLALHVLGSIQQTLSDVPGKVNGLFGVAALSLDSAIGAEIRAAAATRRLVIMGFSYGAGMAQVLTALWQGSAGKGTICLTFGSPRVGDQTFALAVGGAVSRIETESDPITPLPPNPWAGTGTPWGPFGTLGPATYTPAGVAYLLNPDGTLQVGGSPLTFATSVDLIVKGDFSGHEMGEYLRRLSLQQPLPPPPVPIADPEEFQKGYKFLLPQLTGFTPGGASMTLCQGTMAFRTNEESQGWLESWYANMDITAMLQALTSLLTPRAKILAGDCEIFAIRASFVDDPTNKASRLQRLAVPVTGNASSNIKDPALQTNETMDALDMMITSSSNASRRVYPFRGIPDTWITGSALTPAGQTGATLAGSYIDAVKAAGLGFRVYSRANAKQPILGITQQAVTDFLILNVTGHGITTGSLVTIRRVKSNPMLNGRWKVTAVDANTLALQGSQRFFANIGPDGTVQLFQTTTDTIQDRFFNTVSIRKTGRPFGMRRGKRSPRLLHH